MYDVLLALLREQGSFTQHQSRLLSWAVEAMIDPHL